VDAAHSNLKKQLQPKDGAPAAARSHAPAPVGRQLAATLGADVLVERVPRVVAARDEQLAVVQAEHAAPRQQEGGLLVAEDQIAQIDQALEGLALLELGLAALDLVPLGAQAAADLAG
jgi:hypothetical protein